MWEGLHVREQTLSPPRQEAKGEFLNLKKKSTIRMLFRSKCKNPKQTRTKILPLRRGIRSGVGR